MPIQWQDCSPSDALPVLSDRGRRRDVYIEPAAEAVVHEHLGQALIERGGLLVGQAWRGDDGEVTHVAVLRAIPAAESEGTAVSLRMGTSVWRRAQDALGEGDRIVGWYHSHPGLTAFFSDTDRQTQAAFFAHHYSVGWVIDPLNHDEALFIGPLSEPIERGPDARGPDAHDPGEPSERGADGCGLGEPNARSPGEPSARGPGNPIARSPGEPSARSPGEPSAREPDPPAS